MQRFHQVPWEQRREILDQMEDERLRALGYRLIYVETPHILPADKRRELDLWRSERLTPAGEVPWLTLPNALNQARELHEKEKDVEIKQILSELIDWFEYI